MEKSLGSSWARLASACLLLSGMSGSYAQTITHQITLPAASTWCSDTLINGMFSAVNAYRAQAGMPPLLMDTLGMKDAELRVIAFANYMQTASPGTPGFNPHQGWDTTAASIGYKVAGENLAWMSSDPNYIVNAAWQDTLHINAMLANANVAGISCIWMNSVPFWSYEPGNASSISPTSNPTVDSEGWNFVILINNCRAKNGAGPLQVSMELQNSSTWMSN